MPPDPALFYKNKNLSEAVRLAPKLVARAVDDLNENTILNSDPGQLASRLAKQYDIQVPVLDLEIKDVKPVEVDVEVSPQGHGFLTDSRSLRVTQYQYRVPFTGDRTVFDCQPSSFSMHLPRAEINTDSIMIRVNDMYGKGDINAIKKEFNEQLSMIESNLDQIRRDVAGLSERVHDAATAAINSRIEKIRSSRDIASQL